LGGDLNGEECQRSQPALFCAMDAIEVDWLVKKGADPRVVFQKMPLVFFVISHGRCAVLGALLEIDPRLGDVVHYYVKRTILHHAACFCVNVAAVRTILQHRPDLTGVVDGSGRTPIKQLLKMQELGQVSGKSQDIAAIANLLRG
jgi:hypothetical protein